MFGSAIAARIPISPSAIANSITLQPDRSRRVRKGGMGRGIPEVGRLAQTRYTADVGTGLKVTCPPARCEVAPITGISPMLVVGLTGDIASGESTVARALAARGVTVIDADVLARAAVGPGSAALSRSVTRWGPALLGADGAVHR